MPQTWATSGIDLHLDLRETRPRAALERALREAIGTGRLHPGTRLPSSRVLAGDLGIARNTVAEAYGQLVAEGWLTARQGSATTVADRWQEPATPPTTPAAARPRAVRYDLRAGWPDVSAFPTAAWLAAARRALAGAPRDALGYTDPRGRPELRQALAEYLARARGVRAEPERVVICSGFTQGLALVSQVIRHRGATTLAMEAFGHQHHRDVVVASGLVPHLMPVDGQGADVGSIGEADAVLLTPAHQFPLGAAMSARRRTEVTRWAADSTGSAGLVIEDDYDGEFRYDRQAIGALQALAPEHVVYAGTASKTLAPGVRLGWLVLPRHLVDDVVSAKVLADRQTGSIDQLTLAELITSRDYDRQVRRCRLMYRRRRDRLVATLGRQAPDVGITGIAAGQHALLRLPPGWSEAELVARATERGLGLEGLSAYAAPGAEHPPALVVGYGTPPDHAFTTALSRLAAVLAAAGQPSG